MLNFDFSLSTTPLAFPNITALLKFVSKPLKSDIIAGNYWNSPYIGHNVKLHVHAVGSIIELMTR
jgi:hypothetical protein